MSSERDDSSLTLVPESYDSLVARDLIEELQEEYVVRYGGRDETPVDPTQFSPPAGAFVVMYDGKVPVGCAGLRHHTDTDVEVKRMFVRKPFRGKGLSRWLLAHIEEVAKAMGYQRILMETGLEQPEAMKLYETSGYDEIPGFGYYADAPENRCYAKALI